MAALVQGCAAGVVERQAEAEGDSGLDLSDTLEHLLRGHEVHPPELVVIAPVTPGRTGRPLLPSLCHVSPSSPGRVAVYRPVGLAFEKQLRAIGGGDSLSHGR